MLCHGVEIICPEPDIFSGAQVKDNHANHLNRVALNTITRAEFKINQDEFVLAKKWVHLKSSPVVDE
jgi:hypothetical protein